MQRVPSGHIQTSHPAHAPRLPRPIPAQPASTARSVVEIGLHKLRRDLESCFLGACDDYGEVNARQRHPPPTSPTPHLLPADLKLVIASQLGFFMDAELPLVQQVRCLSRLQVAPAGRQRDSRRQAHSLPSLSAGGAAPASAARAGGLCAGQGIHGSALGHAAGAHGVRHGWTTESGGRPCRGRPMKRE